MASPSPRGDAKLRTAVLMAQLNHSRRMKDAQEEGLRGLKASMESRYDAIDSEIKDLKTSNGLILEELAKLNKAVSALTSTDNSTLAGGHTDCAPNKESDKIQPQQKKRWIFSRRDTSRSDNLSIQEDAGTRHESSQRSLYSADLVHFCDSSMPNDQNGFERSNRGSPVFASTSGAQSRNEPKSLSSVYPEPEHRRSIVESSDRGGEDQEEEPEEDDDDIEQASHDDSPKSLRPPHHSPRWLLQKLAKCDAAALAGYMFGTDRRDKSTSATRFPAIHPTSPFMTGPRERERER